MKTIVTINNVVAKQSKLKDGTPFDYWRAYTDNGFTFSISSKTTGLDHSEIVQGQQYLVDVYPVVKEDATWWNARSIASIADMDKDEQLMMRLNLLELKLDLLIKHLNVKVDPKPYKQTQPAPIPFKTSAKPDNNEQLPF